MAQLGGHTHNNPRSDFQYTIMNVGKNSSLVFRNTMSKRSKVNLISHVEEKNAEEDRKKLKVLVPTMRLLADVPFRDVCSHLGAAERNLLAGRTS